MTALTHLSLYRVGFRATPHVPSNDDRIRAYRMYMPTQYANAMFPHGSASPRCRPAPARFPEAGNYSDPFDVRS